MPGHRYLLALGANRRGRHGSPRAGIGAALQRLVEAGVEVVRVSAIIESAPLGPSRRRFANAAALVATDLEPEPLLRLAKAVERAMGRRPGRRWGERVIDIDLIAWSGGRLISRALTLPHPQAHRRRFVLGPAASILPAARLGQGGATLRQLAARAARPRPVPGRR